MFQGPFDYSILKRAQEKGLLTIDFINIRDFGIGRHKIVDDKPYGGGVGMILRVDVVHNTVESAKCKGLASRSGQSVKCTERVVLMDPRGKTFNQTKARELAKLDHLILVAGHYEGIDERILHVVDESVSIGNYILTGGEIPAMVIVDAVARLLTGVLKEEATTHESFSLPTSVLEHPQYTRPPVYQEWKVPKILTSGNHGKIQDWKEKKMR